MDCSCAACVAVFSPIFPVHPFLPQATMKVLMLPIKASSTASYGFDDIYLYGEH